MVKGRNGHFCDLGVPQFHGKGFLCVNNNFLSAEMTLSARLLGNSCSSAHRCFQPRFPNERSLIASHRIGPEVRTCGSVVL